MRPSDYSGSVTYTEKAVRGIRIWFHGYSPTDLIGLWGGLWRPGVNKAGCRVDISGHEIVSPACQCGFYAAWSLSHFLPPRATYRSSFALGVIQGFGNVVLGELGFRCSKAKIEALCPGRSCFGLGPEFQSYDSFATALQGRFPEVAMFKDPVAMAQEFGLDSEILTDA